MGTTHQQDGMRHKNLHGWFGGWWSPCCVWSQATVWLEEAQPGDVIAVRVWERDRKPVGGYAP